MTIFPQKRPYSLFENDTGPMDGPTDRRTNGQADRRTDGQTDTTSYSDALSHLKTKKTVFGHAGPLDGL